MSRFKCAYQNYDEPGLICTEPSLTKQSFKDECDVNTILSKFEATGQLPSMIERDPAYGDFAEVGTFLDAQIVVLKAQEQFSALSAKVRSRFGNDPARFLEYAQDPQNCEGMIELGLAVRREEGGSDRIKADALSVAGSEGGDLPIVDKVPGVVSERKPL